MHIERYQPMELQCFQIMLPEAVAIVMAPQDSSRY